MVEFAAFVKAVFLPSLVLGVALGIAWRYVPIGRMRTVLQWIAALLFFVPQPFVFFLGAYSSGLRLYQQVLLSLWGFGTCGLAVAKLLCREAPTKSGQI